jgi:glycosyltransferase involved in cell wall biosynthesis
VTLEALASGVPTVAFDYGAARECLRDGLHGAAIRRTGQPARDDAAFIAAVARIGSDEATRRRMRPSCREAVSALRPTQVAADFDHLLQSLAQRGHGHVPIAAL